MKTVQEENKFTIQNFDKWMSPAMLKKGKQYFDDNAVLDIGENEGNWTAEVEGSDIYNVTVSLKDREISEYFCDCPYDGDVCKHIIAVFFAMREEIKKQKKAPKTETKKTLFNDLLTKINADEYRTFISAYAAKNKDFKIALELFFADKDDRIDVGEKYTDLIGKLVRKFSDHGFIDYRSSSALANEINKLIDKGYDLLRQKNNKDSFALAVSVLKEMMKALTGCDDSNGSMGGTVMSAIELMGDIAKSEDTPVNMKEYIFGFLQAELADRLYFDYGDFGYDLFSIFEDLAILLNKHDEFLEYIDTVLPKLTGQYDGYRKNIFKKAKIDFLKATRKEEEAEKLIQQNLDIESVRQGEVNKAIDKKDFDRAKALLNEGIKLAEANKHPGTVNSWEKELLRVAVLENDVPLARYYYKKFAFDRSWLNKEYYNHLKNTYTGEEWRLIIEQHIDDTIQKVTKEHGKNRWSSLNAQLLDALSAIYIQEKYWDRLFALVKNENGLQALMQYHDHLASHYPAELLKLYVPALALQGDNASDRSMYASLAATMKKIIKDIPSGKEPVVAVAKSLKEKYPRRPAMIDELNKVLK